MIHGGIRVKLLHLTPEDEPAAQVEGVDDAAQVVVGLRLASEDVVSVRVGANDSE
jgi:hypothetical protein